MANANAAFNSTISNQRASRKYVVATGQTFFEGTLVQLDASGNLCNLVYNNALKVVGQFVRLTPDGLSAEVREGDITLDVGSTAAPVQATVGAAVYAENDHAVYTTSSTTPKAGIFLGFAANGQAIVRCTLETT